LTASAVTDVAADGLASPRLGEFILKVASRCNLDCTYCYVYNKGDSTWKRQPKIMARPVFDAALNRIAHHCDQTGQSRVVLVFHGGEPCLIGVDRFREFCEAALQTLGTRANVALAIQTNGTLLSSDWAKAFRDYRVEVGVSMDGPKVLHDQHRITKSGRGSYEAVRRGVATLSEHDVPFHILAVIPLGHEPLPIHRHFLSLGCESIAYLLPAYTWDSVGPVREEHGPTPCADFLIPVFDDWWFNGTLDVRVREFWSMARLVLGGTSTVDAFGNHPMPFLTIETDGEVHGLDKLRICQDGLTGTGMTVLESDFSQIINAAGSPNAEVLAGTTLPDGCRACPERETCGGGYLPHRYSRSRGFNNPSVWCADLLALFTHVRKRLGVSHAETAARRGELVALEGNA
jgi:uncharacterized protein